MNPTSPSVFSIDVEDGVSIAMRDAFGLAVPQTDRVVRTTDLILELLAKYDTRGTFYVLGQVGEKFPELVRRIAGAGHEIGVHGYNHWQFFKMTPSQAHEELSAAKKLLEDLSGEAVTGHRAPAFSISPATAWAFDVLADCGFRYDSSIMPIASSRYGWAGFTPTVTRVKTARGNELLELPITPLRWLGRQWPYSGGSYLRLLPGPVLQWAFRRNQRATRPNILYIHPYELDTERYPDYYFAAMARQSPLTRLRMRSMWLNRRGTLGKLDALLRDIPFVSASEWLARHAPAEPPTFSVAAATAEQQRR